MNALEKNVRDAHRALAEAVAAARAGGFRVNWTDALAISETAAVKPVAAPAREKVGKGKPPPPPPPDTDAVI